MDPYIRNFNAKSVNTEVVLTASDANSVFEVNNNYTNLKLIHFNVRSAMKNFIQIEVFLDQFTEKFDCIILTETWHVPNVNLVQLKGYTLIYNEASYNQNDGTIIYIKNEIDNVDFTFQKISDTSVINLTFCLNGNSYNIHAMYRPPATYLLDFIDSLQVYLQNQNLNYDYSIFVGDTNIDILEKNLQSDDYLNILAEFGFTPVINKYTRIQGDSKSCLDHIFIKSKYEFEDVILPLIIQTNITDHFPVLIQLVTEGVKKCGQYKQNYEIKHVQHDKLKEQMCNINWSDVYNSRDVESATKTFLSIIDNKINMCTKVSKIKNNMRKRKCWITNGIVKSIEKRDELFRQTQLEPLNENLKNQYVVYRNKLTSLIKKTKISYFKSKINQNKTCTKKLWFTVKEMCNSSNPQTNISKIYNENNTIITDKLDICNIFNNIFSNMGENMAKKIKKNNNYKEKKKININSMFLVPTTPDEVRECILRLKPNKSPGIDGIKSSTLKHIAAEISVIFAFIINKIFETGCFPMSFKVSVVKPLYKNGNKMTADNYRPISLITNFTKVLEMLIKDRLCKFLTTCNILSNKQFGFMEGKSTQDAILGLTEKIYQSLDNSRPSLGVFLDLAKAFDTVSHSNLLQCLEDVGIRDSVLKLFETYLHERKQCVDIGGVRSRFLTTNYGVPQGTVLGPILFLIYLNNLFSLSSEGEIISFADDTVIYYEADTWTELKSKAERDLSKIIEWFNHKLLTINVTKTMFVPFGVYKDSITDINVLNIVLHGNTYRIERTNVVKYLGIYIDCHLRWDEHVNYVVKKIRKLIYMFKHVKDVLNTNNLMILYKALVESHITYGIIGWGGVLNCHLLRLEILQKRILKVIFNKPLTYPSEELFRETRVYDIRQLYFYCIALRIFSEKKNFINHVHQTRSRSMRNISVVLMHTRIGQRCSTYLGPKVYNCIPFEIRSLNSKHIFKKKLKQFLYNSRILAHTELN